MGRMGSCMLGLSLLDGGISASLHLEARSRLSSFQASRLQRSLTLSRVQKKLVSETRCVQQQQVESQVNVDGSSEEESSPENVEKNGSLTIVPHEDFGEVSRILGSRVVEREMQYLIEWEDDHPDTWEPAENIASDVLSEYITPWWQAVKKADEKKLAELLEQDGRDVDAIDENERTALLFAAGLGSEACVRLLAEAGADINWQDRDGFTALHIAAGYVHSSVVKALLELGADPELEDAKGRSALKLAQDLLNRIPKANPLQFARRLALDQVVKVLDEACFETVAVDQILDKRIGAGNKMEYLVKWSDGAKDTWLHASQIAEDLVRDYEAGLEYGVVEKILDKRVQGESVEYLVKWADSDKDSWEPLENVAPELIAEYEEAGEEEQTS